MKKQTNSKKAVIFVIISGTIALLDMVLNTLLGGSGVNAIALIYMALTCFTIAVLLMKKRGNLVMFAIGGYAVYYLILMCINFNIFRLFTFIACSLLLVYVMALSEQTIIAIDFSKIKEIAKRTYYFPVVLLLLVMTFSYIYKAVTLGSNYILSSVFSVLFSLPEIFAFLYIVKWLCNPEIAVLENEITEQAEIAVSESDSQSNADATQNATTQRKTENRKIQIIVVSIIACLAVLFGVIIGTTGPILNEDEEFAYQNAVSMQKTVSDRDSFKLYDYIYIFRHHDENGVNDYTYTVFEYGAANIYGGIVSETVIFKDGEYYKSYSSLEAACDYSIDAIMIKFDIDQCLKGDGSWLGYETIVVDANKILKKMGLD